MPTKAERLLINRRRAGLTQPEAAESWGVSLYQYRRWELGSDAAPFVAVGWLRHHERCLLMRLRLKVSLRKVARDLGVSRWWVIKMERGDAPPDRLVEHWEKSESVGFTSSRESARVPA